MSTPISTTSLKQEIDYIKFARILHSRWYWLAATTLLALLIAYIYLWYTPRLYSTIAYIKFEDKQPDLTAAVSLSNYSRSYTNKIAAESWTFKSQQILHKAVDYIDWPVSYYLEGRVRSTDLYPKKPFEIKILKQDRKFYNKPVFISGHGTKGFILEYQLHDKNISINAVFGKPISIPGVVFYIKASPTLQTSANYAFKFNYKQEFFGRMGSGFSIDEAAKFSSVAQVSKTDPNPHFAADALNAIIRVYREKDLEDKTESAKQIIDFIDVQLGNLSLTVKSSGEKLKEFKQANNFMDLSSSSQNILSKVTQMETMDRTYDLQLLLLHQLQQQLRKNDQTISMNFNLDGAVDPLIGNLIVQWNELIQERLTLLSTYKEQSKLVKEVNDKLNILRESANQNMKANILRITKQKEFNQKELEKAYAGLNSLPTQERQLFGLQRDYNINEKIFSYLSEKKLEAQIGKAAVLASAKVIDPARPNTLPISPQPASVWRMAIIIGLASGIGLIFLARLLNPYIYDKDTIESLTQTPILGMIRHFPEKIDTESSQILSIAKPKSLFAESVRSVRTNLSFVASEKSSKVICVTSEIAGEGKSFVSINLASSLALIDKKVIFIAADLRRSKVHRTFNIKSKLGLSSYLSNQSELATIIQSSGQENLDLIIAGQVPPNPAELMYSPRLLELIHKLKQRYDYILFDTAPIGLVSDALPLIRISDINLFVIRTGKSKISAAYIPQRIANEYQLHNTFIILNDYRMEGLYGSYYSTRYSDNYYGYYYADSNHHGAGYYTDDRPQKWWKRWKSGK
jgi:capsular exopolysaccharide synthesis family protein